MTPPLARRNLAQGNRVRHSEMVVESSESSLFLKRNLCWRPPSACCSRKRASSGPEQVLEQRGGTVLVGVGQGGVVGRLGDAHMHQLAQAAGQAVADLAQRIGAAELTEQHGDELGPAGEALGGTLGGVLLDQCGELGAGEVLEQLIEQAGDLYDWIALLWAAFSEVPAKEWLANVNYRRAFLFPISDCKNKRMSCCARYRASGTRRGRWR